MSIKVIKISRPYYSNPRIFEGLYRRVHGLSVSSQIKFPVTVFYETPTGEHKKIKVRDIDSIYFKNPFGDMAHEHLTLILDARKGRKTAISELSSRQKESFIKYEQFSADRINSYVEKINSYFKKVHDGSYKIPDLIIPSTTKKMFSINEVGDKGFNLLRLSKIGYPIPSFCILSTFISKFLTTYNVPVEEKVIEVLKMLTGKNVDSEDDPLIFSVRPSHPVNMPGFLPTFLCFGAPTNTLKALEKTYGKIGASKIRANYIVSVLSFFNKSGKIEPIFRNEIERITSKTNKVLNYGSLEKTLEKISYAHSVLPFDNTLKLIWWVDFFYKYRIKEIFKENWPCDLPKTNPAIIFQEMVFGGLDQSYSGVFHTRDPKTGSTAFLEIARESFGEEIMTGDQKPEKIKSFKNFPLEIASIFPSLMDLEKNFSNPVAVELTSERGALAILQATSDSLSGPAAIIAAFDMFKKKKIRRGSIPKIIKPHHLRQIFELEIPEGLSLELIGKGTSVFPQGKIFGRAYFSNESALNAKARGEKVILIKDEFEPLDADVMMDMDGLVSKKAAIHVKTISLKYGILSLFDLKEMDIEKIQEGDWVMLSSEDDSLYLIKAKKDLSPLLAGKRYSIRNDIKAVLSKLIPHIIKIKVNEIDDCETLYNLNFLLKFIGKEEIRKDLVNKWFEINERKMVEYFLETTIGNHKSRIDLFMLLKDRKKAELIADLVNVAVDPESEGIFIVGRLLIEYERLFGREKYEKFIKSIVCNRHELNARYEEALRYLNISRVALSKGETSIELETERATKKARRPIKAVIESFDTTHKPHKLIELKQMLEKTIGKERIKIRPKSEDEIPQKNSESALEDKKSKRHIIDDQEFLNALSMVIDLDSLSEEQLQKIKTEFDLDPDPYHKPTKLINRILSKMKIKV